MVDATGYALVLADGTPFSWHETMADAIARWKEERVYARALTLVPASIVEWGTPAVEW